MCGEGERVRGLHHERRVPSVRLTVVIGRVAGTGRVGPNGLVFHA